MEILPESLNEKCERKYIDVLINSHVRDERRQKKTIGVKDQNSSSILREKIFRGTKKQLPLRRSSNSEDGIQV